VSDGGVSAIDIAVIGAGWSGLACAVECAERGARVALIDAAPQAGGRARQVDVRLDDRTFALDNGQHLLIGAYRETERLMHRIGVDPSRVLRRMPLKLVYPDGFRFAASALPASLHLASGVLTARGLAWKDKLALARVVAAWRRARWSAPPQATAISVLAAATPTLLERFFEPLCLAALNLRVAEASAQIFLNVLRDSIGAGRRASEFWIPTAHLSALLPDAALAHLRRRHTQTHLRTAASALHRNDRGWVVQARDHKLNCGAVVLALPPERAGALLGTVQANELADAIDALAHVDAAPIATVYLRYAADTRLPEPVMALSENAARGHYGQWVFDRGALDAHNSGVLAVVFSGHGPHAELPRAALAAAAARQLTEVLALPAPLAATAIIERRATVLAVPTLRRPGVKLPLANLYLAGDAADSPYPSTLEGSVRAGLAAARAWFSDRST
jgi:squalene-associated FAD-dependent desaturase